VEGRGSNGRFIKGNKFGKGRPVNPEIGLLRQALEEVDKETKLSFYKHIARRARKNDQMAIAILRKFVPDKAQVEEILEGDVTITFAAKDCSEREDTE